MEYIKRKIQFKKHPLPLKPLGIRRDFFENVVKPETNVNVLASYAVPALLVLDSPPVNVPEAPLKFIAIDHQFDENFHLHNTGKFRTDSNSILMRRVEEFKIILSFDRQITLHDTFGFTLTVHDLKAPNYGNGSAVFVPLRSTSYDVRNGHSWDATLSETKNNEAIVFLKAPTDCFVTKWNLSIYTKLLSDENNENVRKFLNIVPVYVLFNPWCEEDEAYLEDESQRTEYVLADRTLTYGSKNGKISQTDFYIGQYEAGVLDAALYLIEECGQLECVKRGNPLAFCNVLSKIIRERVIEQCPDKNKPQNFQSSSQFLQHFYKTRTKLCGSSFHCSGIALAVARALGIGCRLVTVFNPASTEDSSLTNDFVFDGKGNLLFAGVSEDCTSWCEVWINRRDLDVIYNGWQALDCYNSLGPAPVAAIGQKEFQKQTDTLKFFARLNCDRVTWAYFGQRRPFKLINYEPDVYGRRVLIKKPGIFEHEDISSHYKPREITTQNQKDLMSCMRSGNLQISSFQINIPFNEVNFLFRSSKEVYVGNSFHLVLRMENMSTQQHIVIGQVNVYSHSKTQLVQVKKAKIDLSVDPLQSTYVTFIVKYEDYKDFVKDEIFATCFMRVESKDFIFTHHLRIVLKSPDIIMSYNRIADNKVIVKAELKNVLPITINKARLVFHCSNLVKPFKYKISELPPSGKKYVELILDLPANSNNVCVTGQVISKQLQEIVQALIIPVNNNEVESELDVRHSERLLKSKATECNFKQYKKDIFIESATL